MEATVRRVLGWVGQRWWSVGVALLGGAILVIGLVARALAPVGPASAAWTEDPRVDRDRDGVPDLAERGWYGSDPRRADTDGDGLPDGFEARGGLSPTEPTRGDADPDGDGLTNAEELARGTHPLAADSDGDTVGDGAEVAAGTDPRADPDAAKRPRSWLDPIARPVGAPDRDRDGLSDWEELTESFTDPAAADTDGDLLVDSFEVIGGTDPRVATSLAADFDGDGLSTAIELQLGTSPTLRDSDGDGRSDFDVIGVISDDADRDGLPDAFEARGGLELGRWTDPGDDPDGDGAVSFVELLHGTHPTVRDTDGDGVDDGREAALGDDPRTAGEYRPARGRPAPRTGDFRPARGRPVARRSPLVPPALDSDRDGLTDLAESRRGTNPGSPDTDRDLLPDRFEADGGLDPLAATDRAADPDADGLTNFDELVHGTRPNAGDSDADGARDGDEVAAGGDPTDAGDRGQPPPPGERVTLRLTVGDPSGSNSERWNLVVGSVRHQAPVFGEVATADYTFVRGRRYRVAIEHAGSSLAAPDYDYTAAIAAVDPAVQLAIEDPDGILGARNDSNPSGKAAWLVIGGAAAPPPPPPEPEATQALRFVRADGGPVTGPLAIGEPYLLEATVDQVPAQAAVATLRWELDDAQPVELVPVPGEPTKLRSGRIVLVNPTDEVTAALPPSPVDVTGDQLAGRWRIEHKGASVGTVEGVGIIDQMIDGITGAATGATLELRFGGRSYFLFSYELSDVDGAIAMKLRGRLPAPPAPVPRAMIDTAAPWAASSAEPSARPIDLPLGEQAGTVIELPRLTDRIAAQLGDAHAAAAITGPYADVVELAGKRAGGRIDAAWQRVRANGEVVERGTQIWHKADPAIDGVIVVEDQTVVDKVGPSYRYPFDNGDLPSVGRTLVVHGRNLPINPGDPIRLDALGEPIWYFTGVASSFDAKDLAKAWQKLPPGATRGPDAIIVRARLERGVLPGPQPLRLNGMIAHWSLEFGDATATIHFVRSTSSSEREDTDTVMVGEHVQLEVRTAGRLPMDELELDLARDGAPLALGAPLIARRTGGARSKVYRTQPLLLHPPGRRERSAPPRDGELAVAVERDDRLLAVVHRTELVRVTEPGAARVIVTPSDLGTLWLDALRRAATCAKIPITDWNAIARTEVEEISNVVVFTWEYRTTKISLSDQAAMILLRDTFVEQLGKVREEFVQLQSSDDHIRKFHAYMKQYSYDDKQPFNQIEIEMPDGAERPFSMIYSDVIVEQHRDGLSAQQLVDWGFAQTRSALAKFVAQLDVALARANDAGDCEVKDLLEITGVGFDRVVGRLLPRLMRLESEPPRQYWVPDRVARAAVSGIRTLAAAVAAQRELASIDNTMIALSLAAVSVGVGAILGEGLLGLVVSLGIDAVDLAFTLATEIPEYYASKREVEFATGAAMVTGTERLDEARAREGSWFSLATSVFGAGLGSVFSAYRALSHADKLAALRRGASLFDSVRARGLDALTEAQRRDFAMFIVNAKARGGDLSAAETAALKWLDDTGETTGARRFAEGVVSGDPPPALVERLRDAENRRVIERAVDDLGGAKLSPQQIDRMIDAHRVGKPPYDGAALKEKLRLLMRDPPAGAGLTKAQADQLLRRGIMGNARPDPISMLPAPERTELRRLIAKPDRTADDRKKMAALWLQSERGYARGHELPLLDRAHSAVAADIAAGRYTPDQFDELVHILDEIRWDVSHNKRAIESAGTGWAQRAERLMHEAQGKIAELGMSKEAAEAVFARFRQAWNKTKDHPAQLFRGDNPNGFTPRKLDVERTSPELRQKFQNQPYYNPQGKGNPPSTLPPAADMEVDHIYPVSMIQRLDGFWKLTPEGRRVVLHFEGNLQGLPRKDNGMTGKSDMLADEWKATGQISKDYYKWLKGREEAMEKRLPQLIQCLLRGGTEAECTR